MNSETNEILTLHGIKKEFSGTRVLKGIDWSLAPGEVHGLLGVNGAGKSTLIKILTGVYHANGGRIVLEGREVKVPDPLAAHKLGIGAVYQDAEVIGSFTIAENIILGNERATPFLNFEAIMTEAREILDEVGIDLDVERRASSLSAAEAQLMTMATLFHRKYKIIILDEPTARLSANEVDILFRIIARFKAQGISIIYISHRLGEIRAICDRITVLRDGVVAASLEKHDIHEDKITQHMVNRKTDGLAVSIETEIGDVVLDAAYLETRTLEPLSFQVRSGEILGITGAVGGGMEQVERALGGIAPFTGEVRLCGKYCAIGDPSDARACGIAVIPEDRRKQALFPDLSVARNVTMPVLGRFIRFGLTWDFLEWRHANEIIARLQVDPPLPYRPIRLFSGGNQQRIVIGKWLSTEADLYIFAEPTSGVDVGAIKDIWETIVELARSGAAVIVVSSSSKEILSLSHSVMVIHDGALVTHVDAASIEEEALIAMSMSGKVDMDSAQQAR